MDGEDSKLESPSGSNADVPPGTGQLKRAASIVQSAVARVTPVPMRLVICLAMLIVVVWSASSGVAATDDEMPVTTESCIQCHTDVHGERGGSYTGALDLSIHQGFDCTMCHTEITELPHQDTVPAINCGNCHTSEYDTYKWHGRLEVASGGDIPRCADCHGRHDIVPSSDRQSAVNPQNLPKVCGKCHEDVDLTRKHEILYGKAVEVYESSVHGKATAGGVYFAATCNDCHSTGGTAHRILAPSDRESTINHFNIPKTCGKCHQNTEKDYWEGIHGKLVARGEVDAPVCTQCHGEHGIISPRDPRSPVSAARVAEATCSPCHESAYLNEKYGIPTGRLQSYVDSYHGLKSKAGDVTVANCASCHGAHRILPHTDPTSSIYSENLKATCGSCHPGISEQMAQTPIHGTPGVSSTPAAGVVKNIYVVAIILIVGAMVVHWLLDLRRKVKQVSAVTQVVRMDFNEVAQHTLLMVSFIVLVVTGFSLRFSESSWVQWTFGFEGGFPLRGIIHRVAAVALIIATIWHLIYLRSKRGRQFLSDVFPRGRDFTQFLSMIEYNIGLSKERPRFGRFSYIEKAEYWALVWGTAVMVATGLLLWFDNIAVRWFPKGFLDVMLVMHYYEAWLATLAIAVWHMYSTVFNPDTYPMNPSWYTGKMPKAWYVHEHPDDPAISPESEEISTE